VPHLPPASPPSSAPWRLITLGRVALLDARDVEVEELRGRPRKLALIAFLALAGRTVPRAQLVELFWGDRDEERARASLAEALSHVRRVVGRDVLPTYTSDVGIARGAPLTIDVLELEAAARAGDHARVVALHRGSFLDGLHIPDAASYERWVERQRGRLAHHFAAACTVRCRALLADGAHAASARLAGRWLDESWDSPEAATALVTALAAPGTPDALRRALDACRRFSDRLARELDATLPPALATIARDLERRLAACAVTAPAPDTGETTSPASAVHATVREPVRPLPPSRAAVAPHRRARVFAMVAAVTIVGTIAGFVRAGLATRTAGAAPVVRPSSPAAALYRAAFARWDSPARDVDGALALLDSAIALDSTFAPAYVLRHRVSRTALRAAPIEELHAAARHAHLLDHRDRLLTLGEVHLGADDASALAIADSLVAAFPRDAEALLLAGRIAAQAQRFGEADRLALRVIALDGRARWDDARTRCLPCEAMELRLGVAYARGEIGRGDGLGIEYAARAGRTPRVALWLAALAEARGLWDAADSLYRASGIPPHQDAEARALRFALRRGDPSAAQRIATRWLDDATPERRADGRFFRAYALREAGRARDGLATLGDMASASYAEQLAWGALHLDAGEARAAAAIFADASTRWVRLGADGATSFQARVVSWSLAHEATARAAAGDTAALAPLAARMEELGRRSLLGRVRTLHHWPRALLWQARGERDSTIASLRRVLGSPTQSHLRAAWLLGRELLAAGRAAEARAVIERALLGPVEASGYFVTRRELRAVLAEACRRLGDAGCPQRMVARSRGPVAPPAPRRRTTVAQR
jgi:DNA-binding SARP family transcriptional activator